MFNSTFLPTNIHETENPNPQINHSYVMDCYDHHHYDQDIELSAYLAVLAGHPEENLTSTFTAACLSQSPILQERSSVSSVNSISNVSRNNLINCRSRSNGVGYKIAFRTKSDLEIMDDGFKWRKYGKKMVKNNPNPRNYYKCSAEGCSVKKRVERDQEDSSYVITTYEGVHNHESPCLICYDEMPITLPGGWTWQASL